jgi:hypothetical protein
MKNNQQLESENDDSLHHVTELEDRIDKSAIDADNKLQYSKRNTFRNVLILKLRGAILKDISKYEPTDLKIAEIAEALNAECHLRTLTGLIV